VSSGYRVLTPEGVNGAAPWKGWETSRGGRFARLVETLHADLAAMGACVAQTADIDDCTG
jgi:hypothetical protein